jgi:hypothetical protein
VFAAWHRHAAEGRNGGRFRNWLGEWSAETSAVTFAL